MHFDREYAVSTWEECKRLLYERTGGKLALLSREEADRMLEQGEPVYRGLVRVAEDLERLRRSLRECIEPWDVSPKRLFHFIVAVNEAVTNALVYGRNVQVYLQIATSDQICRVAVLDHGNGIPLQDIPQAVLVNGYSTRKSLGVGFHAMLHYVDQIWFFTSEHGSGLLLDLALTENRG